MNSVSAIRYMPLGDSITTLCWRALLYRKLQAAGFNMNQIDFVGSQTGTLSGTPCSGSAFDTNHEGHSGFQAVNIASQNLLPGWLSAAKPDIITMHLGTNDQWNNRQTNEIINAFTTMVKQMRASNPNMYIIVAQIIPERYYDTGVAALNARIPSWAAGLSTAQSPIVVVDQNTGFSSSTDFLSDGVHPNDNGNEVTSKFTLARLFFKPLIDF
ncbi:hypothetical protein HK098_005314 [Nowakowskiella sp. JEL0407]|nr:hypothetical protein HK098_005314 [Nowakowskiella sp. JEL0407]